MEDTKEKLPPERVPIFKSDGGADVCEVKFPVSSFHRELGLGFLKCIFNLFLLRIFGFKCWFFFFLICATSDPQRLTPQSLGLKRRTKAHLKFASDSKGERLSGVPRMARLALGGAL